MSLKQSPGHNHDHVIFHPGQCPGHNHDHVIFHPGQCPGHNHEHVIFHPGQCPFEKTLVIVRSFFFSFGVTLSQGSGCKIVLIDSNSIIFLCRLLSECLVLLIQSIFNFFYPSGRD